MAVIKAAIDEVQKASHLAEKQYGRESLEVAEPLLTLGAMGYIVEDHETAEDMFVRYIRIAKAKLGSDSLEVFHSLTALTEVYFSLNRLPEAFDLISEAKSISTKIDPPAYDPILEALIRRAEAYEGKTDLTSRQHGLAMSLMALSWCITRGWHRSSGGAQVLDRLHALFTSYEIVHEEWEWTAKHAHLTKYDFVGLLSILLHETGLAPRPLPPVKKQGLRIIEVR